MSRETGDDDLIEATAAAVENHVPKIILYACCFPVNCILASIILNDTSLLVFNYKLNMISVSCIKTECFID